MFILYFLILTTFYLFLSFFLLLILQIFILIIFETSEDDLKYFDTTLIHDTTVLDD